MSKVKVGLQNWLNYNKVMDDYRIMDRCEQSKVPIITYCGMPATNPLTHRLAAHSARIQSQSISVLSFSQVDKVINKNDPPHD